MNVFNINYYINYYIIKIQSVINIKGIDTNI